MLVDRCVIAEQLGEPDAVLARNDAIDEIYAPIFAALGEAGRD